MKRIPLFSLAQFIGLSMQPLPVFAEEDLAGERRLRETQLCGGFRKARFFRDSDEAAQGTKHHLPAASRPS